MYKDKGDYCLLDEFEWRKNTEHSLVKRSVASPLLLTFLSTFASNCLLSLHGSPFLSFCFSFTYSVCYSCRTSFTFKIIKKSSNRNGISFVKNSLTSRFNVSFFFKILFFPVKINFWNFSFGLIFSVGLKLQFFRLLIHLHVNYLIKRSSLTFYE